MKKQEVYVEKYNEQIQLPVRQNKTDAGYDVYTTMTYRIDPQKTLLVSTGVAMAIPENYMLMVVPRSGLSLRTPLRVANSPGIVDAGYRDELGVIIRNTSVLPEGQRPNLYSIKKDSDKAPFGDNRPGTYHIPKGTRIAQLILVEFTPMKFTEVDNIKAIGEDRGGGFNSTGLN